MAVKGSGFGVLIEGGPMGYPRYAGSMSDFTRAAVLTPEVEASIEDAFEYHKWSDAQIDAGHVVRQLLCDAVKAIVKYVPPCPDRTTAIRKLRDARMDCNSAITHCGKY